MKERERNRIREREIEGTVAARGEVRTYVVDF
jgi:hypothetical protein